MGQLRRFLGIFVSLFIIAIAGNAHAAGYTCDSIKQYTSCNPGYYMTKNGSYSTAVGNTCTECPAGYYCEGGTKDKQGCAVNYYQNETKQSSCKICPDGQYSTGTATSCSNVTASANTKTLTYNGTTTSNGTAQSCANVTVTAPSSSTSVTYSESSSGTYSSTAPTLTNAGSKTIYYKITYSGSVRKSGSYTCTMNTKAMTVSSSKKTLTYNGSSQSCGGNVSVTVPSSGASVTYSESSSGTYSATAPTLTNVGTKTIYYKVTGANFTTKTGSYTCEVVKAACTLTLSAASGSTNFPTTKTFTYSGARGTVDTPTSSNTNVATVSKSGTTVTMTPKATGSATITVTDPGNSNYNGCSKTYTLTVNNGTITATANAKTLTYNGTTTSNGTAQSCANVTVTAPSSGASVTYSESSSGTYSTTAPTLTNVGSKTVYYKITATNYTQKTGSYTCTMNSKAMTVSSSNKTLTYNGSSQSCGGNVTVTTPSSGASVTYSDSSSGTYSATAPTLTNVGTKTIYYKVTGANFTTKTGSYTCEVVKAACTLTLSAASGSTNFPTTKTFTYSGARGTVDTPTSSNTNVATVSKSGTTVTMTPKATGSATITVTDPGNSNYSGCSKTYALTVNNGTITVSAANKSKVYDGSALTCSISVTAPSSGATIKYGTANGTYNQTSAPTVTNVADSKTIYYQVTATNYATKTGSFTCSITRATNSITAIADQTLTYPSTKTVTVARSGDGPVSASSSDTTVATVSVSGTTLTLTPKKVGTTTITVNVAQGSNHDAATPITFKVTVNRGSCTVTLSRTSSTVTYPTNPTTFTATATGNGAFNTPGTSNASVVTATISNGTITPVTKGAGSATITISTAQTDQYNSCSAKHTVTVDKAAGQVVINPTSGSIAYRPGAASTTTTVTTNKSGGTISATSNNTNITTGVGSDGKTITITSNGKVLSNATITVTSAATTNYNSANTTYTLSSVTCGTGYYNKNGTCTACPENSTACGTGSNPDGFDCDAGYTKNAAGDACEPAEYTVTYECGAGATGTAPTETTKPKYTFDYTPQENGENNCKKDGYNFVGWLVSGTSDIRAGKFNWKYTENKTFTAQWDAIGNYSATYSCGDGTGTAPARDTNITFNDSYTVKANGTSNCSRTGYTFAGWSDGSKTVQPGAITWTYTSSKTFTAQWTPTCLAITVDSQNATTNAAPTTVYLKYENGWYSNNICTTALSAFTTKAARTGHTFGGFYTGKTGTGTQVVNTTGNGTFITSATALKAYSAAGTMYAKWTINTYTISYTLNGGTQASSGVPTQYTFGVGATINGKPTRANYLFAGWCTDSGLTSCSMTQTINTTATGNKTFYAKWNGCPDNATCTNNTVTCDDNYDWNEATQTCVLGMIECVAGKYYPGTGTAMVDCTKEKGWYCPGTGKVAIGGGAGCYVACPTSANNGTLTTNTNNATAVTNCMESLTGVKIPKSSPTKNGTANTVCGYTSGTSGSASYEKGCSFTVTQCDAGYYVPVKSESPYSKQGTCEEVGKGFFRAAGTCNANPTKDNDTCMRIACPGTGTTSGNTSDAETQCYITCNTDTIRDGETAIGSKTPVYATLNWTGTVYPACTYTLTCAAGYEKSNDGTATATCEPGIFTVTLNQNYAGGTNSNIYAKYNRGWYSNNTATTSLSKITPPTRTNYTFGGYKDANDTLVIKSDGTFVNAKPTLTADTTLTAVWQGVPVTCVAGKYYTGTGTTMAPCRAGEYCPGDSDVNLPKAYQGTAGCYIKCPKSGLANSVLSSNTTDGTGATSINQCQESLTNIEIPKNSTTKNGTADTKCNYTSGTDGSAKYDTGCSFTVKSCIAGYYVPVKTESPYSKQGTCEEVGRGYYRAAGTCNANPTKDNDTCMRIACPDNGLTTGTKSTSKDACYKDCSKEDIMSNGKKIGERNPVTDAEGNSRAWLISGTNNYDVCYYNASCADGYVAEPENSQAGSTNATCVVGEGWSVTYYGEGDNYTLTGNPIRNFTVATTDRALPTAANVVRTGYTFTGWYDNASLTGTKLTEIPSDRLSAITLYPAWAPKIYPVTVDHNNGTANQTIYLKYATGWYSDANATSKLESLSIPDGSGDEFGGYYYNDDVEVVNASGKFMTNTLTPADNMKIVAVWISQPITCPAGTYYPGNGDITNCKPCESGYYCEGKTKCNSNDGKNYCGRTDCPEHTIVSVNISSTPGATSKTQCIKNNVPYVSDTKHVKSGLAHCPANESGVYNYDAALCTNHSVTTCAAGYYRDTDTAADACEAVGTGWWSDGSDTSRVQCESRPINTYTSDGVAPVVSTKPGTTTGTTSTSAQDCFLELVPFTPAGAHGKGTQTCKWNGFSDYDDHCSDKVIRYCDAGYYRKNVTDTECVPAGADRYSTEGSLISEQCPARIDATGEIKNGETAIAADTASGKVENASSPEACMLRVSYDVPHGTGTKLCEFNKDSVNSATGEKGQYDKNCNDRVITSCDGGYYRPLENGEAVTDACVEVGNNYYRAAGRCTGSGATDTCMRIACPENGLTTGTTSASSNLCYLEKVMCEVNNGRGEHMCYYNPISTNYDINCTTCNVTGCVDGYTEENGVCVLCPAGHICKDTPDGPSNETCATLTNNLYPKSDAGASDISMCYRDCALGTHATSMTGRDYYNNNQCKIAACEKGYILSDGKCQVCPAGHYCPTDNPDDQLECPADWSNSDGLATKKEDCYRSCESYPITGGTALPVNEKAFWPNKCEYKGVSDNGNECDIVDDACVEISCRNIYEMVNGVCVPCNREHALSYLPKGNCMVASCEIGYHPNGQSCEYDVKTCNVPHAYRASQKWDSKLNSFSTCQVEECEEGYHISSNACVADEQVCAVEHGVGIKEWNSRTNSWGDCVATSCDAGYTNDPSETNERSKQCGQCKNKFSVLGELAASTYIRGCEIASCLYQGELYNLENNECVPICDVNGREDETGTMKWDASRKKCVRTCKEGYTMW